MAEWPTNPWLFLGIQRAVWTQNGTMDFRPSWSIRKAGSGAVENKLQEEYILVERDLVSVTKPTLLQS